MIMVTQGKKTPKLRFRGFSDEWRVKRMDKFAPLQRGFDLPISSIKIGRYPVVFSNGILRKHDKFKAKAPGIVTGRSGTIGKVHYVEEDYWPHNTALWVTDFKSNYPKYIYYVYKSFNLERFGTGSGVPTLNRNDIHSRMIAVPEKAEQEKIADFLTMVDKRITALGKKVELLEKYKKGAMQAIFSQKIRFKPARPVGKTGGDENGKDYPDWEEKSIKQCTSFIKDGTHGTHPDLAGSPYFLLSAKNIKQGTVAYDSGDRTIPESEFNSIIKNYKLQKNDILISIVGTIGNIALWDESLSKIAFQRSVAFLRFEKINPNYVFQLFSTRYFQNELKRRTVVSAQPGIYLGDIAKISIPIPSEKEQQKIADFLTFIDNKLNLIEKELEQAKKFKQSLLQRMFV